MQQTKKRNRKLVRGKLVWTTNKDKIKFIPAKDGNISMAKFPAKK